MMDKKTAVILFNLGAPDSLDNVKPFLFNLFNDWHIIRLPRVLRYLLAKFISNMRANKSKDIYRHLGGKSPLLKCTEEQAQALENVLNSTEKENKNYKVFVAMSYWHPFISDTVDAVKKYNPYSVILLPLYPQFSSTTTLSVITDWHKYAKKTQLKVQEKIICCYPVLDKFISAHVEMIMKVYHKILSNNQNIRILFSAHGLPKKIVDNGDPYAWQVSQTVKKIVNKLSIKNLDWIICYQSKVGPLEWLTPSTEQEIKRAGQDNACIILVPIAFVSEHSETLVELDIEYKEIANQCKVPGYFRVPALGNNISFIEGLAQLCHDNNYSNEICPNYKNCLGKKYQTIRRCI